MAALRRVGLANKDVLHLLPNICGCLVMISDHGRGTVGAKSDGRADIHYAFDPADLDRIKEGLIHTARVLFAGGARQVTAPIHRVGLVDNVADFEAMVRPRVITDFTMYASHPMATCRMGLDPQTSVIDPTGQAHGLAGLYLADSSIFPSSLGVNPQLTTMAMATIIGRRLAADGG